MASKRDPEKLKRKLLDFARDFPFFKLIGFELVDLGPGWSTSRVTFRKDLTNANGVIHGGVISTLIDAGITQSMLMTDAYQEIRDTRGVMTNVDLRVKFLRPGMTDLTCEVKVTHQGRTIVHANATVTDTKGKPVATGDAIVMMLKGKS